MKRRFFRYYRSVRLKFLKRWYLFLAHPFVMRHFGNVLTRPKRIASLAFSSCLILLMVFTLVLPAAQVKAQTLTLGANDLLNGTMQYGTLQLGNQNTQLSLQQGAVGAWDTATSDGIQTLPELIRGTSWMAYGPNNVIYHITASNGQCSFRSYDTELQQWNILKSVPVGCASGTKIIGDGSKYIYYLPGGSSSV